MTALPTHHKHRPTRQDATRPRRYSDDPARRAWYALSRTTRDRRRFLGT